MTRPTLRSRATRRPPSAATRAAGRTITIGEADAASVATIMRALPDPSTLPEGTLVVVPGAMAATRSLTRSVLAALGRTKTVARSLRCTALVARGYVSVGAADEGRDDLAWGYAPSKSPTSE